jgi:hypothetical protein
MRCFDPVGVIFRLIFGTNQEVYRQYTDMICIPTDLFQISA